MPQSSLNTQILHAVLLHQKYPTPQPGGSPKDGKRPAVGVRLGPSLVGSTCSELPGLLHWLAFLIGIGCACHDSTGHSWLGTTFLEPPPVVSDANGKEARWRLSIRFYPVLTLKMRGWVHLVHKMLLGARCKEPKLNEAPQMRVQRDQKWYCMMCPNDQVAVGTKPLALALQTHCTYENGTSKADELCVSSHMRRVMRSEMCRRADRIFGATLERSPIGHFSKQGGAISASRLQHFVPYASRALPTTLGHGRRTLCTPCEGLSMAVRIHLSWTKIRTTRYCPHFD